MEGIGCVLFKMSKIFLNASKSQNFSSGCPVTLSFYVRTIFTSFF